MEEQKDTAVFLKGPFTQDDLKELFQTLRTIEQRQADKVFQAVVLPGGECTRENTRKVMRDIFPAVENLPVDWVEVVFPEKEEENDTD